MSVGLPNYGQFSYPGIGAYESFSLTDVSGISPTRIVVQFLPAFGLPDANGDIVLQYNSYKIVLPNCRLDSYEYRADSGGQVAQAVFLDERWKWKDAAITGNYNIRFPNNFVDPNHEIDPQTLVSMCFDALGIKSYDVSQLPNDDRPYIDWNYANPAQEAANICDKYGCRIVPIRSTGTWTVCVTGNGAALPDGYPYTDAGQGIDPKEIPDYIKIVSAPIRYQFAVRLEPAAVDVDLAIKKLNELSYCPRPFDVSPFGMGNWAFDPSNIPANRIRQPDGTLKSPQEFARESLFKTWRIYDPAPYGQFTTANAKKTRVSKPVWPSPNQASIVVPGYPTKVFRKQMILSNELVTSYTDPYGELHKRPAFMFGQYIGDQAGCISMNYPFGRRIDAQTKNYFEVSKEDRRSFNLNVHPVDSDRTTVTTSNVMVYRPVPYSIDVQQSAKTSPSFDLQNTYPIDAARLWLMCAVQIRDLTNWQPIRNEFLYQVGDGTNQNFCHVEVKNDILPWYVMEYPNLQQDRDRFGKDLTPGTLTNNYDEVYRQSLYYAQQLAQYYVTQSTACRTYIGLFPIDMDGALQQVTYRGSSRGYDTIVSRNTEHNFDISDYAERRQRDGRHDIASRLMLVQELVSQRAALTVGGIDT